MIRRSATGSDGGSHRVITVEHTHRFRKLSPDQQGEELLFSEDQRSGKLSPDQSEDDVSALLDSVSKGGLPQRDVRDDASGGEDAETRR